MNSERGKQIVLAVLVVVLAVLMYRTWSATTPGGAAAPSGSTAPVTDDRAHEALAVRLDALKTAWPRPADVRRNLFRFGEARSAAASTPVQTLRTDAPPPPARPTAPSLGLKLIGIVESSGQGSRVAVLGDDRGVYHGHEGDIIEGRYRILRIAADSVEVARLDANVQQVLRLSNTGIP